MKKHQHGETHAGHRPGYEAHPHRDDCHYHEGQAKANPVGVSYYCPMCPGVESDQPGDWPKCGMALERNPAWVSPAQTIYTCSMHPEVQQDHPGNCPKCGMALEPKTVRDYLPLILMLPPLTFRIAWGAPLVLKL